MNIFKLILILSFLLMISCNREPIVQNDLTSQIEIITEERTSDCWEGNNSSNCASYIDNVQVYIAQFPDCNVIAEYEYDVCISTSGTVLNIFISDFNLTGIGDCGGLINYGGLDGFVNYNKRIWMQITEAILRGTSLTNPLLIINYALSPCTASCLIQVIDKEGTSFSTERYNCGESECCTRSTKYEFDDEIDEYVLQNTTWQSPTVDCLESSSILCPEVWGGIVDCVGRCDELTF